MLSILRECFFGGLNPGGTEYSTWGIGVLFRQEAGAVTNRKLQEKQELANLLTEYTQLLCAQQSVQHKHSERFQLWPNGWQAKKEREKERKPKTSILY